MKKGELNFMRKKLLSIISVLGLVTMFAIPVKATDNIITLRAPICTYCGNGTLHSLITYGPVLRAGDYTCIHYPRGYDEKNSRLKIETIKCNYCGYGATFEPTEYIRGTCHGFY